MDLRGDHWRGMIGGKSHSLDSYPTWDIGEPNEGGTIAMNRKIGFVCLWLLFCGIAVGQDQGQVQLEQQLDTAKEDAVDLIQKTAEWAEYEGLKEALATPMVLAIST